MTTNEILARVYKLYPSIAAWVRSNNRIWADAKTAKFKVSECLGPTALDHIFECHHIRDEADREFLRSMDVWHAISLVIDLRYSHHSDLQPDGFVKE